MIPRVHSQKLRRRVKNLGPKKHHSGPPLRSRGAPQHPHANILAALGDDDANMTLPREQVSGVTVAAGREITPEMVRTRAIVPYGSPVQDAVRRLDQMAEMGSAIGLSLIHI